MTEVVNDIQFRDHVSAQLVQHAGSDASVVAAARVSTVGIGSAEALNEDPAESIGLINFLMKNRHGSPFEANSMTFLVEVPIFVMREMVRHRIGVSLNEESGRYRQLRPIFYVPPPTRPLTQVGKAGAYEFVPGDGHQEALVSAVVRACSLRAYSAYEQMLNARVAKEVARMVLPVNIFTSAYFTFNARSMMHFLSLRTKDPRATYPSFPMLEIEAVARAMEIEFASHFPLTYQAFDRHGRVCP